ncbi:MAG: ATP-binding protein [Chloroflexi bacterium]|nr:ATP-binding protein [Chloroflexota bacterium]
MSCPICGGAGFLRRDLPVSHPEFGRAVPCSCKKQETLPALQRWSGLGNSTQVWTLENFPGDPETLKAAKEALAQKYGIWVFWSQAFGTGKTGILVSMIQACWQANIPALYQSVPAMLDRLRASYADGDYDTLMNELKQIPVLALDEFHRWHNNARHTQEGEDKSEGSHSWAEEKIFQIVEERYIHWDERLTLVATNRNPDKGDLDPIASRFSDSLRSRIIHVGGGDLRPSARILENPLQQRAFPAQRAQIK